LFGALPILGLVVFAARPALALWVEIAVTTNGVVDGQQLTVTTKDVEQFKQFEVTLVPHPRDVSPFLTGQLSLIANDKWVASVPVSEKRENGTVKYSFRVAPDAVAQSSFSIHASAYAPTGKDGSFFATAMLGKIKVQQIMGGTIYALKLKDFAGTKARLSAFSAAVHIH
jgi:hypothetical protein